jgi:hypothetical protein
MRTSIYITGSGISSKNTLLRKIPCYGSQVTKLNFGNFRLDFDTKKEAVKALSEAFQDLRSDFDTKNCTHYKRGEWLSYDAGTARIEKRN